MQVWPTPSMKDRRYVVHVLIDGTYGVYDQLIKGYIGHWITKKDAIKHARGTWDTLPTRGNR